MTYNFTDKNNNSIAIDTFKGVQVASTKNSAYIKRGGVYFSYSKALNTDDIKIACDYMLDNGANLLPARISQNNGSTTAKTLRLAFSDYTTDEITRDLLEHVKRTISKIDNGEKQNKILLNLGICGLFDLNVKIDDYNARAERAERERAERERAERERAEAEKARKQSKQAITQAIKADSLTAEQLQAIQAILSQAQPQV